MSNFERLSAGLLRPRLSEVLRRASLGETFIVTHHGHEAARICPPGTPIAGEQEAKFLAMQRLHPTERGRQFLRLPNEETRIAYQAWEKAHPELLGEQP